MAGCWLLPRVHSLYWAWAWGLAGSRKWLTLWLQLLRRHSTGLTHWGGKAASTTPPARAVRVMWSLRSSTGSHRGGAVASRWAYHCLMCSVSRASRSMPSSRSMVHSRRTGVRRITVFHRSSISLGEQLMSKS